jgi:hypothetical protein
MADAGLVEFSHPVESFGLGVLLEQVHDMKRREDWFRWSLCSHKADLHKELQRHYDDLDDILFGVGSVRRVDAATAFAETWRRGAVRPNVCCWGRRFDA